MKTEELLERESVLYQNVQRLKSGEYWACYYYDNKYPKDVVGHFAHKYGYRPIHMLLGPKVDLQIPDDMVCLYDSDLISDNQVWMQ